MVGGPAAVVIAVLLVLTSSIAVEAKGTSPHAEVYVSIIAAP